MSLVNPMIMLAMSEVCDEDSVSIVQCEGQVDQTAWVLYSELGQVARPGVRDAFVINLSFNSD